MRKSPAAFRIVWMVTFIIHRVSAGKFYPIFYQECAKK